MKSILLLAVLVGLAVAQPYASFTTWYYTGCNATTNNYIYNLYVYPADGSCFEPSGGFVIYTGYYYRINANSTHVTLSEYAVSGCTDTPDNATYPIDACSSDSSYGVVASIWTDLPSDDYWSGLNYVSSGGYTWDTILITDYYSAASCPSASWVSTSVQGFQECYFPYHVYCDGSSINYDVCTNTNLDCNSGCAAYSSSSTLDNTCTASSSYTGFWTLYLDDTTSTSFQATCAGGSSSASTLVASVALLFAALALVF